MRIGTLKELVLYRYRYIVGMILLIGFGVAMTSWQLGSVPPGFNREEIGSAIAAGSLSIDSASFVNVPYYLLQKASLGVFGPSALGIRLPSIILAMLMAAAVFVLLRQWFGQNTAVVGTILTVTASQFLMESRAGNPDIVYSLWTAALLATAALVNRQRKGQQFWFWLFCLVAGLSLYTPFFAIILIVMGIGMALSRQSRGLLEEVGQGTLTLGGLTFAAVIAPLVYGIYKHPQQAFELIGATQLASAAQTQEHLHFLLQSLFSLVPNDERLLIPALSLPGLLLALYGLYKSFRHFGNIRYAITVLLLGVSLVLFIFVPDAPFALLFVPIKLLVIFGLHAFISNWYSLFPRNPYARIMALFPLALLLMVMVQFHYTRYFHGLARAEQVRLAYDGDITLIKHKLDSQPVLQSGTIVVGSDQKPFYALLQKNYPNLSVIAPSELAGKDDTPILIVAANQQKAVSSELPDVTPRFLADDRPGDALRFRIYRK
ncbi:glycosyltransferase family 39 protein [Candidatus Saccharibacteria bacterium]|nr:glycosyltransferase family 39 protein [Candidatus Saccharibacteria bacterium]